MLDLVNFFMPALCPACHQKSLAQSNKICLTCQWRMPETRFHQLPDNRFMAQFAGRVPIKYGAACFFFNKSGTVQRLLFEIKYRGRRDLATYLGRYYGYTLKQDLIFPENSVIVPVPLHPRKLRIRGFNQSTAFAEGLSKMMGIPLDTTTLIRIRHTPSQTRRSRQERIENVQHAFQLSDPSRLKGRHVILVDDVLTTGATLESCALTVLHQTEASMSIFTIAIAEN